MKKLICITGGDGVGKSTLVDALLQQIPDVYEADIWDLLKSPTESLPFQSKRQIDDFLCALTPDSRLLFLGHALIWSIDTAMASDKSIILLNSYYYKYFATELALGADLALVHALGERFPRPDLVIHLDLALREAVKRKKVLSRYECGLSDKPSPESFLTFQAKALAQWEQFDQKDWHHLDARLSPEELQEKSLDIIRAALES
ncbi:MAG: hypothetical protein AAF927_31820 [Bacteroidota bacterium]